MPWRTKAVLDAHTSLGPIPGFVVFRCFDFQAGKYGRQQRTDGNATSMTMGLLLQYIRDDFSFAAACVVGELPNGCFQVGKKLINRCLMFVMKVPQFLQYRIRFLHSRMFQRFLSSDTGRGEAAKLLGCFHPDGSLIDFSSSINVRVATVVGTMADQVVSDPHQCTPQAAICLADNRSTIAVRLIALIT